MHEDEQWVVPIYTEIRSCNFQLITTLSLVKLTIIMAFDILCLITFVSSSNLLRPKNYNYLSP